MKFSADKNQVYDIITASAKACATRSTLNNLDGILLTLEGDTLTAIGYDLEIGIKTSVKVDGMMDGKIIVDPKFTADVVKKMPGDTIDVEVIKNKVQCIRVTSGKANVRVPYRDGNDFPAVIEIKKDKSFEIGEKLFRDMISRVGYCVSRTAPELECIKIEIEDNVLWTVGTDASRLAASYCPLENENIEMSLPEKAVASLLNNLSDKDPDSKLNIAVDKNQICISKDDYILISRLLDGKFPQYKRIINDTFVRTMTISTKDLAAAMDRSLLMQGDKLKIPVVCSFEGNYATFECVTSYGAIEEEIEIEIEDGDFEGFSLNFNPRFMAEALQKATSERVRIRFIGNLKPFKITSIDDGGEFIAIIVPIRNL